MSAALEELRNGLTEGSLVADPGLMASYVTDQTPILDAGVPLAVCFPTTTAEVQHVLRVASRHRIPVVPRGAGSGLAGGANATDGSVVLVTTRMNEILELNGADQYARVQPGVLNAELTARARAVGLDYPPDPASWEFSTLGGNIATNAGGLCCLKYGVTGDYVLGLEIVLADGSVARVGRRTQKGVAGYDLTRLFVGSEGTLGVITEATLRLRPRSPATATLAAFFPTLAAAGAAVVDICARLTPSLLELMDGTTIRAVNALTHMDLDPDAAALLLAQVDTAAEAGEARLLQTICEQHGATFVAVTDDPVESDQLLAARRIAYSALERLGVTLLDDVTVPRSRIPELIAGIEQVAADEAVVVGTFGHAGDGNLHPTVVLPDGDDRVDRARRAFDRIVELTLSLGGTVTGEHGVGLLKHRYLQLELDEGALRLHQAIRSAIDPNGILNPGKVV